MAKREDEDDKDLKDGDGEDGGSDGDDLDLDNLDTEGMSEEELRETIAKMADMCNGYRAKLSKREEEKAEEDGEEKRSIVNALFRGLRIDFATKQRLLKAPLAEVKKEALKHSGPAASKRSKRNIDDQAYDSGFAAEQGPGATDDEIVAYFSRFPSFQRDGERLGLTKRSATVTRWGTRVVSNIDQAALARRNGVN